MRSSKDPPGSKNEGLLSRKTRAFEYARIFKVSSLLRKMMEDGPQLRHDLDGLEALSEDGPLQRHAEPQAESDLFSSMK